jgi:hypothetical protein
MAYVSISPSRPSAELSVNRDKLVHDILLDVALLKWFATHRMPHEVLVAIELARDHATEDEVAVLAFLASHCGIADARLS